MKELFLIILIVLSTCTENKEKLEDNVVYKKNIGKTIFSKETKTRSTKGVTIRDILKLKEKEIPKKIDNQLRDPPKINILDFFKGPAPRSRGKNNSRNPGEIFNNPCDNQFPSEICKHNA